MVSAQKSPERNEQFRIISNFRDMFTDAADPIISVDTKKKELVGNFKNPGRRWENDETPVNDHDFLSLAKGRAIPYSIYDMGLNEGTVVVGTFYDTPEFAVSSISKWWRYRGAKAYPNCDALLILADAGGSNGYRTRAWKYFLYTKLSKPYNLILNVVHYPPGASKWNPADHRLHSEISKNWQACPLDSYETILKRIRTTKTSTGLSVRAYLDTRKYQKGIMIPDELMAQIPLQPFEFLPQWNYSIFPN